jgi:cytochrome P450
MIEMINDRRVATKEDKHDLLSNLLDANNDDSDNLTDSDLIGKFPVSRYPRCSSD